VSSTRRGKKETEQIPGVLCRITEAMMNLEQANLWCERQPARRLSSQRLPALPVYPLLL
jgi:hypothetical protein